MEKSKEKVFSMVSTLPPLVGISTYTVELLEALDRQCAGEIFSFRKLYPASLYPGQLYDFSAEEPHFQNIEVFKVIDWYNPATWIYPALKMNSPILHLQWWSPATGQVYYFLTMAARSRAKIIMTVHNILPHEANLIYRGIWRVILRRADGYIVHSEKNREQLYELYPYTRDKKIAVIPHGIPEKKRLDRSVSRKRLGIPDSAIVFLFFGTVREYKGIDVLIQAFKKVRGDVYLVIAGKPWIDPEPYVKLAEGAENIKFDLRLIPDEEVPYFLSAADLVVLPYRWFSSQSGVSSLAIGYGLPVVVSDAGGLPDVADPEAVFLAEDIDGLAEKMQRFVDDPDFRKKLESTARKVKEEFSYKRVAEKTCEFYKEFI